VAQILEWVLIEGHVAAEGEQPQRDREEEDQHDPDEEVRDRHAADGEAGGQVVGERAAPNGGDGAQRYRDEQ
jgi:hypothetical protein